MLIGSKIMKNQKRKLMSKVLNLAVIGLGYVGLPLAIEFAKKRSVIGYDINENRIIELKKGYDSTKEFTSSEINKSSNLYLTSNLSDLKNANIFIVTVPTPVDKNKKPDMSHLIDASRSLGEILKKNDIVIFESTVYPGATEEICVPVLEEISGLKYNKDFFCGYSPERINPGDKKHTISEIVKITSGSNKAIADIVDDLYKEIILVGTHKVKSIKVAEAAKVIENTQRDLNIALINELSIIFNKLNIDTQDVLKAASTKWNFIPFFPGLVGGHCIGVDPYYLTHKSIEIGYHPEVILAGRRINDNMHIYVVDQLLKALIEKKVELNNSRILILGLSFKENCPDLRNSKVFDLINELNTYKIKIDVFDPIIDFELTQNLIIDKKYNNIDDIEKKYDAIIIAVAHREFLEIGISKIKMLCKKNHIIYDLKNIFPNSSTDLRL